MRLGPLLVALQLGLIGCGGNDLLLPSAGQPSKISIVSGNEQAGTVGQPLDTLLTVVVTDPEERPVAGVEVAFIAPPGAALEPSDTVVTGTDGMAQVRYTLSPVSGNQQVEARAKPVTPSTSLSVTFSLTANPEEAVRLNYEQGDKQTGEVSKPLEDSLAVKAVDRFGNGVPGVEVHWEASGGSVSAGLVPTGADGRSAVQRTLGDRPGTYETRARAGSLEGSPIAFTSTAVAAPSPALELTTAPSATAHAGVPFAQQPVLQLVDPVGAPLAREDVRVTVGIASGGGALQGANSARSDASGRVRFRDLAISGEPGTRMLIFAAEGFTPATATVDVTTGPPSPSRSVASVPNGTAGAQTVISIHLEDDFGNRISGAAGSIDVSVSGANEASGLDVADLGNGDYSAGYTPAHSGTDLVNVRVNGAPLNGSPFQSQVAPGPASAATTSATVTRSAFFFGYLIDVSVIVRDAQGNPLNHGGDLVEIRPAGGEVRQAQDNGDGSYVDRFFTTDPNVSVGIMLNGQPIAGSPFTPQ